LHGDASGVRASQVIVYPSFLPKTLLTMIVLSDLHIVVEFGSVLFNLPAMVGLFVDRFAPLEFDQGSAWTPSRP